MSPDRGDSGIEQPDRVEGFAHPRETYELFGQDLALAGAARAVRNGSLPQGLLLAGPPGIGKATLAYRIARYLLRYGATAHGPADLFVAANDPVSRLIEAQAHPALLVLKRRANENGKLKKVLDVDEVRRAAGFFGLTAGGTGWRVAIVDCADDLNDNAANALLKVLEEPPARSLFILIGHAPGRLLPTIRSRVRRLDLKPLSDDAMAGALARLLPDTGTEDRTAMIQLADGSLGLALRLAGEDGLKLARDAEMFLNGNAPPDIPALFKLSDRVARSTDGLAHFGDFLIQGLSRRVRTRALQGQADEPAVELWEQMRALFVRAAGINLEPRQTILASAEKIATAKRHGAL